MKWAWRDDAVVIYQWDDCSWACKLLPGVSWRDIVDFQPGFIFWWETGAHYADIQDHIRQIYDFQAKKTKVNSQDFMASLNVTCTNDFKGVFRGIWADQTGYIDVRTVRKSHCCVSGGIYEKLWKLHTWCLSHRVKNITTSQEVPFI